MKKIFILALVSLLGSAMFGIEARVLSVSGKVQVQRNNVWVDLKPNDVIRKGEMVQTGFKSEAQISITSSNQNSKLTIAPLSRLTIEQLVEGKGADKASVYVATGSVKSEIKKTEDRRASYTVRGPVATASVRGTVITMTNGFDSVMLETAEGNAAFYPTANDAKSPKVSSADEDKSFSDMTAEQGADANIYPATTGVTSSVKAGQAASVSGNESVSVCASAQNSITGAVAGTSSMMAEEMVSTVSGVSAESSSSGKGKAALEIIAGYEGRD